MVSVTLETIMTLKYEVIRKKRSLRYNRHGVRHRVGGPAVIMIEDFGWYEYGVQHRMDGPSMRGANTALYFIRGLCYNKQDYDAKIRI